RGRHSFEAPTVGTWCHGETGIALARLRAAQLAGPGGDIPDPGEALEIAWRHLEAASRHDYDDLSLCHGLGGPADVLLSAARSVDGRFASAAQAARDLGASAIERHASAHDWPGGVPGGRSPGLLVGLSGVALLML